MVTFEHIRCNAQFDPIANTFPAFARTASKGIHFAFVPGARFLPSFRRRDRTGFIFGGIFILLSFRSSSFFPFHPPKDCADFILQRHIHFRSVSRARRLVFVLFCSRLFDRGPCEFDPRITSEDGVCPFLKTNNKLKRVCVCVWLFFYLVKCNDFYFLDLYSKSANVCHIKLIYIL